MRKEIVRSHLPVGLAAGLAAGLVVLMLQATDRLQYQTGGICSTVCAGDDPDGRRAQLLSCDPAAAAAQAQGAGGIGLYQF